MLRFENLKIKDTQIAKDAIFNKKMSKNSFYSTVKKSITYFMLLKSVYIVLNNDEKIGILLIDSSNREIYFYPLEESSNNINFNEFINSAKERFSLKEYTFNFNCREIKDIDTFEKDYEIINSVKFMKCDLNNNYNVFSNLNTSNEFNIRKYTLKQDEKIRVELQNQIFNSVKGRSELTLKDVMMEEYSPRFIEDMCFILESNEKAIGYGQIINLNESFYLANFGVISDFRGKGCGRYLLHYIMLMCYKKDMEEIYLTVDNNNFSAIKLYASNGFYEIKNNVKIKL